MSVLKEKLVALRAEKENKDRMIGELQKLAKEDGISYEDYQGAMEPLFNKVYALEEEIRELEDAYEQEAAEFAVYCGYSDVYPYEIIKRVSAKCIEVREMNAERDESVKLEWEVGGFSGVCKNPRDQKWFYSSNEKAEVIRIRLGKKGWKDKYGRQFALKLEPYKYYDYNF